jgi:hypothetical protein
MTYVCMDFFHYQYKILGNGLEESNVEDDA